MSDGVDYERACKSAGIAPRTIYNWKSKAEAGDETAIAFVQALEKAEADVERRVTRNVLKASEKDAYWAAGVTFLERRYPDRWGKRDDSAVSAKVQVSIGGPGAQDVLIGVQVRGLSPSVSEDFHSLTPRAASDQGLIIGDYVPLSDAVPTAAAAPVSPPESQNPAQGLQGDPTPRAAALRQTGPVVGKGRSSRRKEKRP